MLRLRFIAIRFSFALAATAALPAATAWADLELPAPSPAAKVSQRVGITDVSVEYSSPAVGGRVIFGDLVPWDKAWRTGANSPTKITFSRDATFGGAAVPAGTYAIVTLPGKKAWQIALNKDLTINVTDHTYNAKDELVRVNATTSKIAKRERMIFAFSDTSDDTTSLDLEWDKLRVSVPIKVDTAKHVDASIKALLESDAAPGATATAGDKSSPAGPPLWRQFANAARYVSEKKKDYPAATAMIEKSLALKVQWYNNWIKADILHRQGNDAEALKFAQIAKDLGDKEPAGAFFYKDTVEKALVEWKGKK